jgi:pyruvate/2-oxoglutarate dehydrogenase complex dihydrolipoamide dehydrogenase (E3) component
MSFDYDLVVIGNSPEGIFAAIAAASFKARVALVRQFPQDFWHDPQGIYQQTFNHIAYLSQQLEIANQIGVYQPIPDLKIQLSQVKTWAQEVSESVDEQSSAAILSSLGIDFIRDTGEFCRLPYQAFVVGNRKLRSRRYLLAMGSQQTIPYVEKLKGIDYLTPKDFWQQDKLASLPDNLVIIGNSADAVIFAQNLRQADKNITLVIENEQILPTEDLEVARLMQAQLEAVGVKIFLHSQVTQVRRIDRKKWIQAGDRAIEADEILVVGASKPNLEGLNLEGVGVKVDEISIQLNRKLQTTNPHIYACGSTTESYGMTHIARYEASIAVKNALFFPINEVDYQTIPYLVSTNPPIARVGMTEAQGRMHYGKNVWTVKQNFKAIAQAQILGETTGFCKIIVRSNGKILGAHIVGTQSGEFIGAIALAMKNKIKLNSLADTLFPSLTLSEIISNTAIAWQSQNLKQKKPLGKLLEILWFWLKKLWRSR